MPEKEHDWDLNVISTDPSDPEGLDGKTYGMITGGRKIQVGDTVPEGVVEGFVDRGVRILPDTGPEYTRKMGDYAPKKMTPRAQMRDDAAEMALDNADHERHIKYLEAQDVDPPTDEERADQLDMMDRGIDNSSRMVNTLSKNLERPDYETWDPERKGDLQDAIDQFQDDADHWVDKKREYEASLGDGYPRLSDEEEEEYPEDLRVGYGTDADPGPDHPIWSDWEGRGPPPDHRQGDDFWDDPHAEQEDTGDVDYIPHEGG